MLKTVRNAKNKKKMLKTLKIYKKQIKLKPIKTQKPYKL